MNRRPSPLDPRTAESALRHLAATLFAVVAIHLALPPFHVVPALLVSLVPALLLLHGPAARGRFWFAWVTVWVAYLWLSSLLSPALGALAETSPVSATVFVGGMVGVSVAPQAAAMCAARPLSERLPESWPLAYAALFALVELTVDSLAWLPTTLAASVLELASVSQVVSVFGSSIVAFLVAWTHASLVEVCVDTRRAPRLLAPVVAWMAVAGWGEARMARFADVEPNAVLQAAELSAMLDVGRSDEGRVAPAGARRGVLAARTLFDPEAVRDLAGHDLLVVRRRDAWSHASYVSAYTASTARLRALELGRPLLWTSPSGTRMVDAAGGVSELPDPSGGGPVALRAVDTPFAESGWRLPALTWLLLLGAAVYLQARRALRAHHGAV